MIEWLKWLIAPREMAALHRYRIACQEAWRWNGQIPASAETARWIRNCGDDNPRVGISDFRDSIRKLEQTP